MHKVFTQLQQDHHHLQRLLSCICFEMNRLEHPETLQGEIPIMVDALDYIQVYPERWHHPAEDAAFEILKTKNIETKDLVAIMEIEQEHHTLERHTKFLSQLFNMVLEDKVVPMATLSNGVERFVTEQAAHIQKENQHIYPLLKNLMTDEDWDKVAEMVSLQEDPLFKESVREGYERLYDYILEAEKEQLAGIV